MTKRGQAQRGTKRSPAEPTARVVMVQDDLVTFELVEGQDGSRGLTKNEIVYVCPTGSDEKLKAEVLRVRGDTADAQVYEVTRGVAVGDGVIQTGEMLSVTLGPGLLGQIFDGLQNPLESIASDHGFFLARGADYPALDPRTKWAFTPTVSSGARLRAGDVLGTVPEGRLDHKILVPFDQPDEVEVLWIQQGSFSTETPVVGVRDSRGAERSFTLAQKWPVRRPLPERLLKRRLAERLYPSEPMTTTQRIIDVFFPIARGGTACIPGPFGAGKTVLQHLIARHSTVDIVVVIACGERAGEVVETITEFPELTDPRTGAPLMDRTVIVCNTSSMPVASREASIYTGITLGEYYRQMGYDVLCIADSTSRWAQAMRETSGRLEEIPGEEAFPAYLDSSIKTVYERAGVLRCPDGSTGSLTLIGTVSPAGGNFEEPVTQATLGTVKTFLGLSADRAYKRFYPAIEPLMSWSRYLEQLEAWFSEHLDSSWVSDVEAMQSLLQEGNAIEQMMQVTGEEGVTLDDVVTLQKATLVDMVYLQQDAFDKVDASTPRERQVESFRLLRELVEMEYTFETTDEAREVFTRLIGLFKNLNYTPGDSRRY
ncbi:MAG: V-type ATP synthase subunit A, partial [Holophagales bacterium]|nr:V-type ATP synthase subunit A [Holophagales bacterium]